MVIVMRGTYYPGTQLSSCSQKWLFTLKSLRGRRIVLFLKPTDSKWLPSARALAIATQTWGRFGGIMGLVVGLKLASVNYPGDREAGYVNGFTGGWAYHLFSRLVEDYRLS